MAVLEVKRRENSEVKPEGNLDLIRALQSVNPAIRCAAINEAQKLSEPDQINLKALLSIDKEFVLKLYGGASQQSIADDCIKEFFGTRQAFFEANPNLLRSLVRSPKLYKTLRESKIDGIVAVLRDLKNPEDIESFLSEGKLIEGGGEKKIRTAFNFLCCSSEGLEILKTLFLRYKLNSWSPQGLLNKSVNQHGNKTKKYFQLITSPDWLGAEVKPRSCLEAKALVDFLISSFPCYTSPVGAELDVFSKNEKASFSKKLSKGGCVFSVKTSYRSGSLAAVASGLLNLGGISEDYLKPLTLIKYWNNNHERGKYPAHCKKIAVSVETINKQIELCNAAFQYFEKFDFTGPEACQAIESNLVKFSGDLSQGYKINQAKITEIRDMLDELANSILIPAFILKNDLLAQVKQMGLLFSNGSNISRVSKCLAAALFRRFSIQELVNFSDRYHLPHTQRPASICPESFIEWRPLFSDFVASNGCLVTCETSSHKLAEHSKIIGHCVGTGLGYANRCATYEIGSRGLLHIVGFRSADGAPISTIELSLNSTASGAAINSKTDIHFHIRQWSGFGAQTRNLDPRDSNDYTALFVREAWNEFLQNLASSKFSLNIQKLEEAKTKMGGLNEQRARYDDDRTFSRIIERVGYYPSKDLLKKTILHWHRALAFRDGALIEKPAIYRNETGSSGFASDSRVRVFVAPTIYELRLNSIIAGSGSISRLNKPNGTTLLSNYSGYTEKEINDLDAFQLIEQLLKINLDDAYRQVLTGKTPQ